MSATKKESEHAWMAEHMRKNRFKFYLRIYTGIGSIGGSANTLRGAFRIADKHRKDKMESEIFYLHKGRVYHIKYLEG